MRAAFAFLAAFAATLSFGEDVTAVASRVNADYVRARLPDGSFQPESYAFGKGGYMSGALNDTTIDKMDFMDIARTLAGPLQKQKYVPASDPKTTRLLIMVYWGTTQAPENAAGSPEYQIASDQVAQILSDHLKPTTPIQGSKSGAQVPGSLSLEASNAILDALLPVQNENAMRDLRDAKNAALLGYNSEWDTLAPLDHEGTALQLRKQDMKDELEQDRYFVILMAYDFQKMAKSKEHVLLWETRFSINEHRRQFDRDLPAMAEDASRYFGKDSHGLVRKPVAEGRVDIGNLRDLGSVPNK